MKRTALGGLDVSAQGLGCMGMSEYYGATDWDTSLATIGHAIEMHFHFVGAIFQLVLDRHGLPR